MILLKVKEATDEVFHRRIHFFFRLNNFLMVARFYSLIKLEEGKTMK